MRIGLLTGSIAAIPSIQSLQQQQILCGIAAQDVLVAGNPSIEKWLQQQSPEFIVITQSSLNEGLKQWLEKCKPDIVIVYGFSWVLPQQLFSLSQFGFFNIHFSLLPAYKGPVPLFWQLKNSEKTTGISIHQMTEKLDAGKVVFQLPVDILAGETLGLLTMRLAQLSVQAISQFLQQNCFESAAPYISNSTVQSSYQHRPEAKDLLINWETMNAVAIENLVNAANPVYSGAICFFRGQELRLIEVNSIEMNNADEKKSQSGLIVSADETKGIIVKCTNDSYLQINIVGTGIGLYSGCKWVKYMAVKQGELLV